MSVQIGKKKVNIIDELDISDLIQVSEEEKLERRMVLLDLTSGAPVASTIKRLYGTPVEEPKSDRKRITPEQRQALQDAWAERVLAKRRLDDNTEIRITVPLKKQYFAAIDNYKRLHQKIYGGS